jgi:hypothetical protein
MSTPQLLDGNGLAGLIGPLYRNKAHWIIIRPVPPLDAVLRFARIGARLGAGTALCLLPVPVVGLTAVVLALPKSETKPRQLLQGIGFGDGDELARLEEEMAAGRDIVCLASETVGRAVAEQLRPFLEGKQPGSPPRPRLDLLRRYRRRGPHYLRLQPDIIPRGVVAATMSPNQWDHVLAEVYAKGGVLVEVDDDERVIALYRKRAG